MLYFPQWKIILVIGLSLLGILATLPNFVTRDYASTLPDWLPHRQLVLGLDLQGGSHLLLAVDTDAVIAERLEAVRDDVRRALRDERIGYTGLGVQGETVQVRIREADRLDDAETAMELIAQPVESTLGGIGFGGPAAQDLSISRQDGNQFVLTLTDQAITQRINTAVEQSIEIVRRRIDELGTTEPTIQRQGAERILVQVPGLDDPARLKALIGQTAKLVFRMVDVTMPVQQALDTRPPPDSELLYSVDDPPIPYLIERRVIVAGENLVDAQPGFDQRTNEPIVTFRFDTSGARRFATATQQNVGRPFAIVLDNEVISAPVIREPILGGSGQISGDFTVEQVNDLAILLRAGALPAPLTILEERTVGPGLGADSVAAGRYAAVIGMVGVVVFMIAAYGLFGVFANIALLVNMALLIGALSLLQATLTLPDIAGIVLTIGMAVDANVLIFERIREEARAGRSAISSIDTGYRRALTTILDANITTLLAAIILFWFGTGPVRGFAVTLAIGIMTSVFTAFVLNRLMVAMWVKVRRPAAVPI